VRARYGHAQAENIFYNARLLSEGDPEVYAECLLDTRPRADRARPESLGVPIGAPPGSAHGHGGSRGKSVRVCPSYAAVLR
jgi:hypothetical protein